MKTLITGATGFIGSHLTLALLRRGDSVRALARAPERAAALAAAGAQVVVGDLAEPASCSGITRDIDVVFHLASAISGSEAAFAKVDIAGTEMLIAQAELDGVKRFVFPGTLSSYDLVHAPADALIHERTPFDASGRLGQYARAKARAEQVVLDAHRRGRLEGVVVRLGLTCGGLSTVFPPHVGRPAGSNLIVVFGDGRLPVPLVFVDNAVEALMLAADSPQAGGESFNIIDTPVLTQDEYLALYRSATGVPLRVVKLPRLAYYALGSVAQLSAVARGKEPSTTPYRVRTRLRRVRWDSTKAREQLHWQSRVPLAEALQATFRAHAAARTHSAMQQAAH